MRRHTLPTLAALLFGLVTIAPRPGAAQIKLSAEQAVARALRHNLDLRYERLSPKLSTAPERAADAPYDTVLVGSIDLSRSSGQVSAQRGGLDPLSSTDIGGSLSMRKKFSTTGTTLEAKLSSMGLFGSGRSGLDPAYQSGLSLSVRQPLLRGISKSANEVGATTARVSRQAAKRELARKAQLVAAQTLKAYWELYSALSKVNVQQVARAASERVLAETQALIAAGKRASADEISARYAVEVQRRAEAKAMVAVSNARDRLARLIGAVKPSSLATPKLVPSARPTTELPATPIRELQATALTTRGDFLSLLDQVKVRQVELSAARHQLLPKLDLVGGVTLSGLSGRSSSDAAAADAFDSSYWASFKTTRVGWSAGLVLEIPLGNSAARSKREMAELNLQRARTMVEVATQALSLELNIAYRAATSAHRQLELSESALKVARAKLAHEKQLYKAGKSTAHILSTVVAEAVQEELNREQALADFNKALVDLFASAGTLVKTNG